MPKLSFCLGMVWRWRKKKGAGAKAEKKRRKWRMRSWGLIKGLRSFSRRQLNVGIVPLPDPVAALAMTYPPGYHLSEENYNRIASCPKHLCVHGLYQAKSLCNPPKGLSKQEVMNYQFHKIVRRRINRLIPQIGSMTPQVLMKVEMNKHGKHIPFLKTPDDFATFALNVYRRYQFHKLLRFVARRIAVERIGKECVYRRRRWIGVKVTDFLRIANSFKPIRRLHGQVNLQLLKKDGRYFLYEVTMCVTRDGMPASRSIKTPEVFQKRKKAKPVPRNSYVYMMK